MSEVIEFKSWVCLICGWIYNEEEGLPDEQQDYEDDCQPADLLRMPQENLPE